MSAERFFPGWLIGCWGLAVAVAAAGALSQYALAATVAVEGAHVPLFSSFNAAHFQLDYLAQGFIKRGLAGTLLAAFDGAERRTLAIAIAVAALLALCAVLAIVLWACRRRLARADFRLLAALWLALPTGVINLGYDIGRLDHLNLLLLVAALAAQRRGQGLWVCMTSVLALLIHEAYLFYGLPLLMADALSRPRPSGPTRARCEPGVWIHGLVVVATLAVLWGWGRFEPGRAALIQSLDGRVPAAHNVLNVWLRSLAENLGYVGERWAQGLFAPSELLLFGVLIGTALGLAWSVARLNRQSLDMRWFASLAVLPLFALGVDYARWVALFWTVSLAAITLGVLDGRFTRLYPPRLAGIVTTAAIASLALGPVGSVHAFPVISALWQAL
ncbi:hypothetical protein [Salinisphaera sp. T31B1]|uniref:hypothetical protein n=1 Tax=Salinisphaera sp. T31B1 TaxID=727963 RepID=UPI00334064D7